MPTIINYTDGTAISIEPNSQMFEDVVAANFARELEGKVSRTGDLVFTCASLPVESTSSLKAHSTAVDERIANKNIILALTLDIIDSCKAEAKDRPFVLVAPVHHTSPDHYLTALISFKPNSDLVDLTIINSLQKLKTENDVIPVTQAYRTLVAPLEVALNDKGYTVNAFEYKEHYYQYYKNSCGVVCLENAKYELATASKSIKKRLHRKEDESFRASQQYRKENRTLEVPPEEIPTVSLEGFKTNTSSVDVFISTAVGCLAGAIAFLSGVASLPVVAIVLMTSLMLWFTLQLFSQEPVPYTPKEEPAAPKAEGLVEVPSSLMKPAEKVLSASSAKDNNKAAEKIESSPILTLFPLEKAASEKITQNISASKAQDDTQSFEPSSSCEPEKDKRFGCLAG